VRLEPEALVTCFVEALALGLGLCLAVVFLLGTEIQRDFIHPSQDLHAMISHVLKGLVQLQKTGFKWDLMYKGKLYKDVTMIPYVAFLRVDTKEADLFCGKYTNRNKHVAMPRIGHT